MKLTCRNNPCRYIKLPKCFLRHHYVLKEKLSDCLTLTIFVTYWNNWKLWPLYGAIGQVFSRKGGFKLHTLPSLFMCTTECRTISNRPNVCNIRPICSNYHTENTKRNTKTDFLVMISIQPEWCYDGKFWQAFGGEQFITEHFCHLKHTRTSKSLVVWWSTVAHFLT